MEGTFKWKNVSKNNEIIKDNELIVKNLMDDMQYEFRVSAVNEAGQGEFSDSSGFCRCKSPICKHFIQLKAYNKKFLIK